MHKLFLTAPECEVIKNSEEIISDLGGFPSMEDGALESVEISGVYPKLKAVLIFDISHWFDVGINYGASKKPKHSKIKLEFVGLRDIMVNEEIFMCCGEIKFGNTHDKKKMVQDIEPDMTPVIPRPFCSFYARNGSGLLIEFDERECEITASYFD